MVDRQVRVAFSIGSYKDENLCDVVLMEAAHILPGRPWKFDQNVTHNGVTNIFTFVHMEYESQRHERHEMLEIHGRHKRVRDEPRREKMDGMKRKIPPFLGENKLNSYLDWEMKVA
ncbi:hypothetical protein CR513_15973, partial [Mucuna pruriens]